MPDAARTVLPALAALAIAAGARAQEGGDPAPPDEPPISEGQPSDRLVPGLTDRAPPAYGFGAADYTIAVNTELQPASSFDDGPGDVRIWRAGAAFNAAVPLNARMRLSLGAESEYSNFDFDRAGALHAQEPFEEVSYHQLSARLSVQQTTDWAWIVGGNVASGLEGEAKFSDSISARALGGVMYTVMPNFRVGVGAVLYSPIEEKLRLYPVPLLDVNIRFTEEWSFRAGLPDGASLTYAPRDDISFSLVARLRYAEYRLNSTSPVPDGIFREWAVPLTAEVNWHIMPELTLRAGAGFNIYQRFELDDREGHEVGKDRLSTPLLLRAGLSYRF